MGWLLLVADLGNCKYDLTLLEDNPYDEAVWNENKGTEFAPMMS